jgi:hypothetical protein
MSLTPEQARAEQLAYGRSTLRANPDYPRRITQPAREGYGSRPPLARKPNTGGHDVILKAMQEGGQKATIITQGDGVAFEGVITGRDKYTITLKTAHPDKDRAAAGETIRRVFYKSAIEQFWGEEVRRNIHDTERDEEGFRSLAEMTKAVN